MTTEPIISVKDLKKSYGSKEVLKGVSLDVYPDSLLGILDLMVQERALLSKLFLNYRRL